MPFEPSIAPHPVGVAGAHGRSNPYRHSRRRVAVLTFLSIAVLRSDLGHAYASQDGSVVLAGDDARSRGTWAALLLGYVALGALATGGAYLLRDNVFGRTVAVGAAGWGGLGIGAGAGYGLARLSGCESADCSNQEQVAVGFGGVLGGLAAAIAGHLLTSDPGMSRPYTTAFGLAPALVFLMVGTVTDW